MKTPARKYFPVGFSLSSSCQATELTLVILIKQELKTNKKNPKNILKVTILKEYIGLFFVRQYAQQTLKTIQKCTEPQKKRGKVFFFQTQNESFWKNCTNHHKTWTLLSHPWTFMHPSQWLGREEIFRFRLASQLLLHEEVGQSHKKNIL